MKSKDINRGPHLGKKKHISEWCPGGKDHYRAWNSMYESVDHWIKRKRLRCKECGKRLLGTIMIHDNEHWYVIPPHKTK